MNLERKMNKIIYYFPFDLALTKEQFFGYCQGSQQKESSIIVRSSWSGPGLNNTGTERHMTQDEK